jgi:hypothetical protein
MDARYFCGCALLIRKNTLALRIAIVLQTIRNAFFFAWTLYRSEP